MKAIRMTPNWTWWGRPVNWLAATILYPIDRISPDVVRGYIGSFMLWLYGHAARPEYDLIEAD